MRRMGSSWAEAWGLFFYCEGGYAPGREGRRGTRRNGRQTGYAPEREGRRGTRRNGAQTDERAGVENEAQGLKPREGEKQGTGSIRGEILKAFSAQVA